MSITRLQHKSSPFAQSALPRTLQFASNVTAGSLLEVTVSLFNNRLDTVSVSDSVNGAYTQAGSYAQSGSINISKWYFPNSAGGSQPTVTVTPSGNDFLSIAIAEYSGVATTSPVANTQTATGSSANPATGTVTINAAGDLVTAAYGQGSSHLASDSVASPFTEFEQQLDGGNFEGLSCADDTNAAGNEGATFTTSASVGWAAIGVCYKQAGGGATPTFTLSPATIPKNHSGHITLTLTGTNTAWTVGTTFTLPSITGLTKISQNVASATSATIVVTTGTGTGTGNITDSTDSATAALTVAAPGLSLSPTSCTVNTTVTVTATGTNTVWIQETAASLFSYLSGPAGTTLDTIVVNSDTSATFHMNAGSTTGTGVVNENADGPTATFTVNSVSGTITPTWPPPYFTAQRDGSNVGTIPSVGSYTGGPADKTLEANFNGGAYADVAVGSGGTYSGNFTGQAAGEGIYTIRFKAAPNISATVSPVKVGDVWFAFGDSVCDGRLTNAQTYTGIAGANGAVYKNGGTWQDGNDPTSTGITAGGGSLWPLLLTQLIADLQVPQAIIPYGFGGLAASGWIANDYAASLAQITAAGSGGVKGFVMVLGTNDASGATTEDLPATNYILIANKYHTDLGVKGVVHQIGYDGAGVNPVRLAASAAVDLCPSLVATFPMWDLSNVGHFTSGGNPDALGADCANRIWAGLKAGVLGGSNPARGPRLTSIQYNAARTTLTVTFDQALKAGLTFDAAAWSVTGNGVSATVSGVAYGTDTVSVVLSLSAPAALPILVSYGLGTTTGGLVVPRGADITLPAGGVTYFPAEPFQNATAAPAEGSGGGSGSFSIGSSVIVQGTITGAGP